MNRNNRLLVGGLGGVIVIVAGLLLLLGFVPKAKADPDPSPPALKCLENPVHYFSGDPGKTATNNLGPVVANPSDQSGVEKQFGERACVDPLLLETSLWHLGVMGAPANADEINQHASWVAQRDDLRKQDFARFLAGGWGDGTSRKIVTVPAGTSYWTIASHNSDGVWTVYQVHVTLANTEPMLEITTASGAKKLFKLSCGFQPVSPTPFTGVPKTPTTTIVTIPPPPPGGGTTTGNTTPPTAPPTTWKCQNASGICGTPNSGPEQQGVQDNDPNQVAPTPGYTPGNAEHHGAGTQGNCAGQAGCPGVDSGGGAGSSPSGSGSGSNGGGGTDAGTGNVDSGSNPDPSTTVPPGDPGGF